MTISTFFLGRVLPLTPVQIISITSEDLHHEKDQLVDWQRPRQFWRSTSITEDQEIIINLGPIPTLYAGLYMRGMNFQQVMIEANDRNEWTSPLHSTTVTLETDPLVERKHLLHLFRGTPARAKTQVISSSRTALRINNQYIRLLISQEQNLNTDDRDNYRISVLSLVSSGLAVDVRARINLTIQTPQIVSASGLGHSDITTVGERILTMNLPWDWLWDQQPGAAINEEEDMLDLSPDSHVPVIVCRDINQLSRAYLVRRVGNIQINSQGVGAAMPLAYTEVG